VTVIIRVALMLFLIQFLVVLTIMVVALLVARPEVPLWGCKSGREALIRSLVFVSRLPRRTNRTAARLLRFICARLFAPVYPF
jgi:hypothetical protein